MGVGQTQAKCTRTGGQSSPQSRCPRTVNHQVNQLERFERDWTAVAQDREDWKKDSKGLIEKIVNTNLRVPRRIIDMSNLHFPM